MHILNPRRPATRAFLIACALAIPAANTIDPDARTLQAQQARALWRSMIADLLVEFRRSATPAALSIGLADSARAVSMSVRGTDASRFADSLLRILSRRTPPKAPFRLTLEEPGLGSGSLQVSRREVPAGERPALPYTLFASDDAITGVSAALPVADLRLFATRLRAAARAVAPPRAKKGGRDR